jgi:hypothetical protein
VVPVVLVVIIVVAWLAILGPNLVKRRSRAAGVTSVSHFRRSLRVLEHGAPESIVKPAFRLRAVGGPGQSQQGPSYPEVSAMPVLTVVGADKLPRPALAFLGEDPPPVDLGRDDAVDRTGVIRFDDLDQSDSRGDRSPVLRTPHELPPDIPGLGGDVRVRREARQRRRATLGVLASVFFLTLMIGFVPGAGAAWIVSIISGLALAAYVVMLVQLRRAAEERERKLSYLHPGSTPVVHPIGVAGVPVYMSGRYAHPSNQAAVAR